MFFHRQELARVARGGVRVDAEHGRLLHDVLVAVAGVRVVAQPLRAAPSALRLNLLKHLRQIARVVSGARHYLRAEQVGLLLVPAAVLERAEAEADLTRAADDLTDAAADDRARDLAEHGADLILLRLGGLRCDVAKGHVAHLVRHDAGHLALGVRGLDHAAVEEHRPAGQREGVDVACVNHVERVAELRVLVLRRDGRGETLADRVGVLAYVAVAQDRHLLVDLLRVLLTELHVVARLVLVPRRCDVRLRERRQRRQHEGGGQKQRRHPCGAVSSDSHHFNSLRSSRPRRERARQRIVT